MNPQRCAATWLLLGLIFGAATGAAVEPAAAAKGKASGRAVKPGWIERADRIHEPECDDWITSAWTRIVNEGFLQTQARDGNIQQEAHR